MSIVSLAERACIAGVGSCGRGTRRATTDESSASTWPAMRSDQPSRLGNSPWVIACTISSTVRVTRDTLAFRWVTNITDRELHLFTDPRGNREVTSGGRLPALGLGAASSLDGSAIAPLLTNDTTYYWQVWGKITTSHGAERVKSALSQFVYFEELGSVLYLGLSDTNKSAIKDELIAILAELVNKRAAKSIKEYEIVRIVLDNGVVTRDEILAILAAIKEKQVKVNSIYFR